MSHHAILAASAAALALVTCADAPREAGDGGAARPQETAAESPQTPPAGESETAQAGADAAQETEAPGPDEEAQALAELASRLSADFAGSTPGEERWLRVSIDGNQAPHPVWHTLVMPGETVSLSAQSAFTLAVNSELTGDLAGTREWTAPDEPGIHEIVAFDAEGNHQLLTAFVLAPTPSGGNTVMEGYRIGTYPRNTPEGFIRLADEAALSARVSPNFTVGQFICKQQPGHWPKFVLVTEPMLVRVEALLAALKADGRTGADSFFVMSGFRTPFYNTAIGSARLSRHMYGDAADIFVDVDPENNVMDDINGDGRVSRSDAEFMYDFASELYRNTQALPAGGIGAYGSNAVHGPFVHVDGRGRAARWGRHG